MATIITATSPIEGVEPGTEVTVPDGKAAWYLANGYATNGDATHDHLYDTSTEAALDPTLAENREPYYEVTERQYNPGGVPPEPEPPEGEGGAGLMSTTEDEPVAKTATKTTRAAKS